MTSGVEASFVTHIVRLLCDELVALDAPLHLVVAAVDPVALADVGPHSGVAVLAGDDGGYSELVD